MNLTPVGRGRSVELGVDAELEVQVALPLLERLLTIELDAFRGAGSFDAVLSHARNVRVDLRERGVEIRVGGGAEAVWVTGPHYALRDRYLYALECQACGRFETCHHVLAALLALAWEVPALRRELSESAWRRALAPLLVRDDPPDTPDERPRGWIRAVLHGPDHPAPARALLEGTLSLQLVPTARRTGKPLKARGAPRSLEAVERKVRDLPVGDRALCRLAEQRRLLSHMSRYRYAESVKLQDELQRTDADLFAALTDATEVWYGGAPVQVDRRPWQPTLRITDAADGGLRLTWLDPPLVAWPCGEGYVLGADRVLRPIDPTAGPALIRLIGVPLPRVPAGEIDIFVHEVLDRAPLRLQVDATRLPVERMAPVPRLVLRDDAGRLLVEPRFAYGVVEVPRGGPALARIDTEEGPRFVQRDLDAEAEANEALDAVLPDGQTALEGEAAYDFLLDGLPRLDGWELMMDPSLRERQPQGTLSAAVHFSEGSDWFDLDVAFELEGRRIPATAVLGTWRAGRRYLRLDDGTLARLPETWLSRHGEAATELAEMRSARGRGRRRQGLGAFAAPLADALLSEVDDTAAGRWREAGERIRGFDRVPERALPPGVEATLRDYQHRGFRWLAALRDLGLAGVLADDMGLGKTLQALVVLAETHQAPGLPSLVVAPTSVIHNWVSEAARFTPGLRVALYYGASRGAPPSDVDLVVTSYALLRLDPALRRPWRYAVLDEAQQIKNPTSQVAKAARALDAVHRLALTGTPLENHLRELWSIFSFLMPGFFGGQAAFNRRYVTPILRKEDPEALAALQARLRPFVLRRLKAEVASELPPRTEQILYCELGEAQRRLYEAVRETYRDQVFRHVDVTGLERSTIQVLEALTRLRQACCHPDLLPFPEAREVRRSAKLEVLWELLDEALAEGHRALVFSQWPSLLKIVAAELDERGVDYLYLDGATRQRADLQTRWNDPEGPPLFLISLKAGGTGLNLVGADHVIHLDPWWNPQAEQQATDRAHRIGQTRPVMVYKLVARDTAEERILELQDRKRALFEATLEAGRLRVDKLTRDDLVAVLGPPEE